MYSLSDKDAEILLEILRKFAAGCEIRAFGSRHKGIAKPYSDLDLVLVGSIEPEKEIELHEALMNSALSIKVDVLQWDKLSESFKEIIEKDYSVLEIH